MAPPAESEARDIVFGNDLVGYAVWGGRPYVLYRHDGRLTYDRLWADPISLEFPPLPRWQLTGRWSSIALTDQAASVGVASCLGCAGDAVLFGEVTLPTIVAMEVRRDGAWERYEVSAPGFLVRLGGEAGAPDAYRWIDVSGAVVYASEQATQLLDEAAEGR